MFENNFIPDTRKEIATPDVVKMHPSICKYADKFIPLDPDAKVTLLIGRDSHELMTTVTHGATTPVIHETPLGWAAVGIVCPSDLVGNSKAERMTVLSTGLHHDHYDATTSIPQPLAEVIDQHVDLVSEDNLLQGRAWQRLLSAETSGSPQVAHQKIMSSYCPWRICEGG